MKRKLFILIIIVLSYNLYSQELIFDTCFQKYNIPKNGSSAFNYYLIEWNKINKATPDFFNKENPAPYYKQPKNFVGNKFPYFGYSYTGIIVYSKDVKILGCNWREYISTKLKFKLIKGEKYCLSMYVSLGDTCNYAADGLEAYFSTTISKYRYTTNLPYEPQIKNIGGSVITNGGF